MEGGIYVFHFDVGKKKLQKNASNVISKPNLNINSSIVAFNKLKYRDYFLLFVEKMQFW